MAEATAVWTKGSCNCKGVVFEATFGNPAFQVICHCKGCQLSHSTPVAYICGVAADQFRLLSGEELLDHLSLDTAERVFCKKCGTKVFNRVPKMGVVGCLPARFETPIPFVPNMELYAKDRVLKVHSGLPVYEDTPSEWGGSGKRLEG